MGLPWSSGWDSVLPVCVGGCGFDLWWELRSHMPCGAAKKENQ